MQLPLTRLEDPNTNLVMDEDNPHYGYPKAIRSQADNQGDYYSEATSCDTGPDSLVRPEYGREADINYILDRFGVEGTQRPIKYGEEVDYTLDLQTAMMATEQADRAHRGIPPELRSKYPTYKEWLNAINSGQYMADLQDLTEKAIRAEDRKKAEAEAEKTADAVKTEPVKTPKEQNTGVS